MGKSFLPANDSVDPPKRVHRIVDGNIRELWREFKKPIREHRYLFGGVFHTDELSEKPPVEPVRRMDARVALVLENVLGVEVSPGFAFE